MASLLASWGQAQKLGLFFSGIEGEADSSRVALPLIGQMPNWQESTTAAKFYSVNPCAKVLTSVNMPGQKANLSRYKKNFQIGPP